MDMWINKLFVVFRIGICYSFRFLRLFPMFLLLYLSPLSILIPYDFIWFTFCLWVQENFHTKRKRKKKNVCDDVSYTWNPNLCENVDKLLYISYLYNSNRTKGPLDNNSWKDSITYEMNKNKVMKIGRKMGVCKGTEPK